MIAQSAAMEGARLLPALEGEVLGDEAVGDETASAVGKRAGPEHPLSAVEGAEGFDDLGFELRLARGKNFAEGLANGIGFIREANEPFLEDLQVAELAETAEEFAAGFAELVPGGIGVHSGETGGHGAAAAKRNAEIVDGVGGRVAQGETHFAGDALHPMAYAPAVFSYVVQYFRHAIPWQRESHSTPRGGAVKSAVENLKAVASDEWRVAREEGMRTGKGESLSGSMRGTWGTIRQGGCPYEWPSDFQICWKRRTVAGAWPA